MRVGGRARRGLAAARGPTLGDRAPHRRRAWYRRACRGAGARRLRARRARGRARPVRRARRDRGRVPLDRTRAVARRALRRRDRAGASVLALHAARPAHGRSDARLPRGRAAHRRPRARPGIGGRRRVAAVAMRDDLVPPVDRPADSSGSRTRCGRSPTRRASCFRRSKGRASSIRSLARSRTPSRRSGPPSPRAASRRRRTSSRASYGGETESSSRSPIVASPSARRRSSARSTLRP